MSEPFQADVGVGQGSALSPVLSALYISPVFKLFDLRKRELSLACTCISYVDDGTLIAQAKDLDDNMPPLRQAYSIIYTLFTAAGLALEHDKTELFHFSRANYEYPVVLNLGYAPYTKDKCLTPKLYCT